MTADFRTFYGVSIHQIGKEVSYLEAYRLLSVLLRNPSSWVAAKQAGWEHPATNEWMVLAHTYDLLGQANFTKNKPKPYPKPWKNKGREKLGTSVKQSARAVLEKLRIMNPNLEV